MNELQNKINVDKAFELLTSSIPDLKTSWIKYLKDEYKDVDYQIERLNYIDVGEISRFIVAKKIEGETMEFQKFFETLELILNNCDGDTEGLMVIGLMEGIQNIGGSEIDYYKSFDKWLKPTSKKFWGDVIDFWEGKEWREKNCH